MILPALQVHLLLVYRTFPFNMFKQGCKTIIHFLMVRLYCSW